MTLSTEASHGNVRDQESREIRLHVDGSWYISSSEERRTTETLPQVPWMWMDVLPNLNEGDQVGSWHVTDGRLQISVFE